MAHDFAIKTGQPLHWYYASDKHSRNTTVVNADVKDKAHATGFRQDQLSPRQNSTGVGMPVMISQNFDVPGGVVNGCMGKLTAPAALGPNHIPTSFPAFSASAMRCMPNGADGASRNQESKRACKACGGREGGWKGAVGLGGGKVLEKEDPVSVGGSAPAHPVMLLPESPRPSTPHDRELPRDVSPQLGNKKNSAQSSHPLGNSLLELLTSNLSKMKTIQNSPKAQMPPGNNAQTTQEQPLRIPNTHCLTPTLLENADKIPTLSFRPAEKSKSKTPPNSKTPRASNTPTHHCDPPQVFRLPSPGLSRTRNDASLLIPRTNRNQKSAQSPNPVGPDRPGFTSEKG
ncbi:hypothetical protein B0H13DRAFT_2363177 [Mycena leptocephala]|nr:hypothetical protein B0H13DRAFT_2363177 [Mycena leptocephala]